MSTELQVENQLCKCNFNLQKNIEIVVFIDSKLTKAIKQQKSKNYQIINYIIRKLYFEVLIVNCSSSLMTKIIKFTLIGTKPEAHCQLNFCRVHIDRTLKFSNNIF